MARNTQSMLNQISVGKVFLVEDQIIIALETTANK